MLHWQFHFIPKQVLLIIFVVNYFTEITSAKDQQLQSDTSSFQYLYKVNNIIKILEVADIMKKLSSMWCSLSIVHQLKLYQADFQKCIIRKILYNFISDLMLVTIFQIIAGFQFIIGLGFFIILQSNAWSWNSTASLHCMQYFIYLHKYDYISNGIFLHTFLTIEKHWS